jgi:enoyl-CoA hydratase/carnithine racemase
VPSCRAAPLTDYVPEHFVLAVAGGIATVTLNRPERKNPLTFESYSELRDMFYALQHDEEVRAVVLTGAGGNFCSGGDVYEIIAPLTTRDMKGLLAFTRMTGDLVKAMRACPQPIVAAVDGVCAGAGAILAMASDIRLGTPGRKWRFCSTGWACRLRHGGMRRAAAPHRPWPGLGAVCSPGAP